MAKQHFHRPIPTHLVSSTIRDNVASPGQKHNDPQAGQIKQHFRNERANLLQAHGARSFHESGRNSTAASAANPECQASYTPLTAQTLYEHDLQQATCSQLYDRRYAAQQGHVTGLEAAVAAPLDGPTSDLQAEGTKVFNNIKLYDEPLSRPPMHRDQTKGQQQSISSTYNEASFENPTYQATYCWSRSSHQEHIMDTSGYNEFDIESLYWNMDPGRELTAWGNDLAGVGDYLAGSTYQGYAISDDFVVDQCSH